MTLSDINQATIKMAGLLGNNAGAVIDRINDTESNYAPRLAAYMQDPAAEFIRELILLLTAQKRALAEGLFEGLVAFYDKTSFFIYTELMSRAIVEARQMLPGCSGNADPEKSPRLLLVTYVRDKLVTSFGPGLVLVQHVLFYTLLFKSVCDVISAKKIGFNDWNRVLRGVSESEPLEVEMALNVLVPDELEPLLQRVDVFLKKSRDERTILIFEVFVWLLRSCRL